SQVPAGTYLVTVSARGYQNASQNVTVTAGGTTTANFGLTTASYAIRVNAGGPALTDASGNVWQADTGFAGGYTYSTAANITTGAADPRLFQVERYTSGPLQYSFSNLPSGTYTVNLY